MNELGQVNCRVGSLEILIPYAIPKRIVNCRVGSLEILIPYAIPKRIVNCRVGSLEITDFACRS